MLDVFCIILYNFMYSISINVMVLDCSRSLRVVVFPFLKFGDNPEDSTLLHDSTESA